MFIGNNMMILAILVLIVTVQLQCSLCNNQRLFSCPPPSSIASRLGCNESSIVLQHGNFYAINNCTSKVHPIPDRFTALQFDGFNRVGNKYEFPFPVTGDRLQSSIKPNNVFTKLAGMKSNHKIMMHSSPPYRLLKGLLNPSFEYFQDDLIISWRLRPVNDFQSSTVTRIVRIPRKGHLASKMEFPSSVDIEKDFLALSKMDKPKKVLPLFPYVDIENAEDMRLFVKKGVLMGHFARRFSVVGDTPEIQTCFGIIDVLRNGSLEVNRIVLGDVTSAFPKRDQKNWCHFHYNDSISFISAISPFTVLFFSPVSSYLRSRSSHDNVTVEASPIGVTVGSDVLPNAEFGQLRGGSSALILTKEMFPTRSIANKHYNLPLYLLFYHSSTEPSAKNCPKTYSMGALLFSVRPPFHPVAMSEVPIVHSAMYTGPWVESYVDTEFVSDYVVFPMTVFTAQDQGFLHIMYGYQDLHGYTIKLKVTSIVESLVKLPLLH